MPGTLESLKNVFQKPRSLLGQSDWTNGLNFFLRIIGLKVNGVSGIRIFKFSNVPGISGPH